MADAEPKASALTNERIQELRDKHGEIKVLKTKFGRLVVKVPPRGTYNRFTEAVVNDRGNKTTACLDLIRGSLVYPDVDVLEGILDKQPGYLGRITGVLKRLAGDDDEGFEVEGN